MARSGPELALLLLGGFRALTDAAIVELARRGYEDVRPVHDFAMRAIVAGAGNASELGRRLSVTKQAAAKTIALLEERGYVARETIPGARRTRLRVTEDGLEVLRQGESIFNELRRNWERQIGAAQLERLESQLSTLVGTPAIRFDTPGWLASNQGEGVAPVSHKNTGIRRSASKATRRS
jgi:DNA-binding MarR family transcriptional regulator